MPELGQQTINGGGTDGEELLSGLVRDREVTEALQGGNKLWQERNEAL
jgi:hypothetical protein